MPFFPKKSKKSKAEKAVDSVNEQIDKVNKEADSDSGASRVAANVAKVVLVAGVAIATGEAIKEGEKPPVVGSVGALAAAYVLDKKSKEE